MGTSQSIRTDCISTKAIHADWYSTSYGLHKNDCVQLCKKSKDMHLMMYEDMLMIYIFNESNVESNIESNEYCVVCPHDDNILLIKCECNTLYKLCFKCWTNYFEKMVKYSGYINKSSLQKTHNEITERYTKVDNWRPGHMELQSGIQVKLNECCKRCKSSLAQPIHEILQHTTD